MQREVLGRGLGRRGEAALHTALFYLFDFIILVMVSAFLFNAINTQTKNPAVEQRYLVSEIGLLLEAVQAVPGNAVLLESSKFKYRTSIQDSIVTVGNAAFPFHGDKFLVAQYHDADTEGYIRISKTDGVIQVAEQKPGKPNFAPFAPPVDTAGSRSQKRIRTYGDTQITQYLIGAEQMEGSFSDMQQQSADADLVVGVLPGAKLYIPDNPESRKLASLILRELPPELSTLPIIPISTQFLAADELKGLIRYGVELQISGDATQIGRAIDRAIDAYYHPSFTIAQPATRPTEVIGNARVIT